MAELECVSRVCLKRTSLIFAAAVSGNATRMAIAYSDQTQPP